jgi:chemotaxis protein methyltransferase WspC
MYLLDKGILNSSFEIDAADISSRALACAKSGEYGNNSFRGKHYHAYQAKYFSKQGDIYKIDSSITDKIRFYKLNILHTSAELKNKFDFILCRNLLIYFDIKTKQIAFQELSNILKNDGNLFIGHSEFGSVPDDIFYNTGFEQAFGLVKPTHPDYKKTHEKKEIHSDSYEPVKLKQSTDFESLIKNQTSGNDKTTREADDKTLENARKLANSNQLKEAGSLCHQYIDKHGDNAEAFFLLGLIASSQQKEDIAESLYRKGIFLDPENHELLIHLSLLLQAKGDQKNAVLFRKRADRELKTQATRK